MTYSYSLPEIIPFQKPQVKRILRLYAREILLRRSLTPVINCPFFNMLAHNPFEYAIIRFLKGVET